MLACPLRRKQRIADGLLVVGAGLARVISTPNPLEAAVPETLDHWELCHATQHVATEITELFLTLSALSRYNKTTAVRQPAGSIRVMTFQRLPALGYRSLRASLFPAAPRAAAESRTRLHSPSSAETLSAVAFIGGAIALVAVPGPG